MVIVYEALTRAELKSMAAARFKDMVKAVVDVRRGILAVDAEQHGDLEEKLVEIGSNQRDIWGISLVPDATDDKFIQYNSRINIRPAQGNHSQGVESEDVRRSIHEIVSGKIQG